MLQFSITCCASIIVYLQYAKGQVCTFDTGTGNSLKILEIYENAPVGKPIFDFNYEPQGAELLVDTFRSKLADYFQSKFRLDVRDQNRSVALIVEKPLHLPNYPSKFTSAYLTFHILCNKNTYPISILKINSINRFAPIFYHTPYVMKIPEDIHPETLIDTPMLAIDWDPANQYTVSFRIESGNIGDTFSVERIQNIVHAVHNISYFSHGLKEKYSIWSPDQLPHVIKLRINQKLDFESQESFSLTISAEDTPADVNLKPKKKYTILKIDIQDVDDLPPVFEQKEYFGKLNGNDFGRTIVNVKAHDGDKTLNATIRYQLFTESLLFEVDSVTGEVRAVSNYTPATYMEYFQLWIKAEQVEDPTKFSVVPVKITNVDFAPSKNDKLCLKSQSEISRDSLINENDLKFKADHVLNNQTNFRGMDQAKRVLNDLLPLINTTSDIFEFEKFVYEVSIHESTQVGSDVIKVRAKVKSGVSKGSLSITYSILSGSADFVIDEDSGMIKLAANLNMNELSSYILVVQATEHSTGLTCFTVLWINVLDHAEPRLIFDPIPDRIYISQSKPTNTTIFTLKAYKIGQENDSNTRKFSYSVNEANHYFTISDQSDKIIVATDLIAGEYKITVTAVDEATVLSVSHDMIISVLNDSSLYPVFDQLTYELDLYENDTQTKILNFGNPKVKNGNVFYEMMPPIVPGITIDREKGSLIVNPLDSLSNLNQNQMKRQYIIIRAKNTADPAYFSDISVILNDKEEITKSTFNFSFISPLFRTTLPENSPAGTVLNLTLSISGAKEAYKKITYSLDANQFFDIDQSGVLYLIKPIDLEALDPSLNGVISLTAYVRSAQSTDSTIVQVKILDEDEYSPSFAQETYEFTVDQNAAPGSISFTVAASDADFNDHSLKYETDPENPYFSVNTKGVFMRTNFSLPQTAALIFNFTLIALDQGNKTASTFVVVELSKSAAPFRSSPYVWSIPADRENPTFDMTIPKDGKPIVSIIHGNEDDHFVIDQSEQEDAVKVTIGLHGNKREIKPGKYYLVLAVQNDSGRMSYGVLEIDIKPEVISPVLAFGSTTQFLSTNHPKSVPVMTIPVLNMQEIPHLTFELKNDTGGYFTIDQSSGSIYLSRVLPDGNSTYKFSVLVYNGNESSTMDVNMIVFAVQPSNASNSRLFPQDSFTFTVQGSTNFIGNLNIRNNTGFAATVKLTPERYSTFFAIDQNGNIRSTPNFKRCEYRINDEICFIVSVMDANNRILDQVHVSISFNCTRKISTWLAILPKYTKPGDQVYIAQLQNFKDFLKPNESLHLPSNPCFAWDPERRVLSSICRTPDNFTASADMLNFTVTSDDPAETAYQKVFNLHFLKTDDISYENIPKIEESIDSTINTVQYISTTITAPSTSVNETQDLICRSAYFEKSMQNITISGGAEVNITTTGVKFESQDAEKLCAVTYTLSYAEEFKFLPQIFAINQHDGRIHLIKPMDEQFFNALYKLTNQNRYFALVVDAAVNNSIVKLRSKITINVNYSAILNLNKSTENFTFDKNFYDFKVDSANMLPNGSIIGIVKVKSDCEKLAYEYRLSSVSELPLEIDQSSGALYLIRSSSSFGPPISDDFQIQIINKQTRAVVASVPARIAFQESTLATPKFDIKSSVTKNLNNISELVIKIIPQYATSQFVDLYYKLNNMQDLFYMQVQGNEAEIQMINPSQTPIGTYILNISVTSPDIPTWTDIFNITVNITEEIVASGNKDSQLTAALPMPSKIFYQEIETATLSTSKPIMQLNLTSSNYTHVIRTDDHKDLFDFNETSGEIKLKRYPRSEELGKGYMLALGLVNDTKMVPSTETLVHIYFPNISKTMSIADQNATNMYMNRIFPKVVYYVEIPENVSIGTSILELNSILDTGNRKAYYKIKSGSDGKFDIGLNTGVITVTSELDAEKQTKYLLVVKSGAQNFDTDPREIQIIVYNSNTSQNVQFIGNDETIVFINVTDVNDNAPMIKFAIKNYDHLLFPVQNISRTVGSVPAYDLDSTSKLQYSLLKVNDWENFTINQNYGLISIRNDKSIGEKSVYNFEILVTDGFYSAQAAVTVLVLNETTKAVVHLIGDVALNLSQIVHEFVLNSSHVIVDIINITNQSRDNNGSYLVLYGYNTTSSNLLEGRQLVDFITKNWIPSSNLNLPSFNFDNVAIFREFEANAQKLGRSWVLSATEIALLIAVACLLIVLLICGAILACLLWNKVINCGGGRMKEDDNYMLDSQFSTTKPYEKHLSIAK